jgi:hypothetical protein
MPLAVCSLRVPLLAQSDYGFYLSNNAVGVKFFLFLCFINETIVIYRVFRFSFSLYVFHLLKDLSLAQSVEGVGKPCTTKVLFDSNSVTYFLLYTMPHCSSLLVKFLFHLLVPKSIKSSFE